MEVTISAATSIDGYIANNEGETDWVSDWELFEKTCKAYGCIAMGRTTYEEGGSIFAGVQHIVLSTSHQRVRQGIHFVSSAKQAVDLAKRLGFTKLLVIGGSKTNQSFIESGLVEKLVVDVHPLILGEGKRLFGQERTKHKLHLVAAREYKEGFVHIEYELG